MECWNSGILDSQEGKIVWLASFLLTHHSIFPLFQMGKITKLGIRGEQR